MSVTPKFASHAIGSVGSANTIELYLDYVCPFSAKLYKKVRTEVIPALDEKYPGKYQFVFRHQIQPFHPASTFVHDAALAVSLIEPEKFWTFSDALFEASREYYSESVYNESRKQTYDRLAELVNKSVGIDKSLFLELVSLKDVSEPHNRGNILGPDMRSIIKLGRQNGIHASPTVLINGIIDNSIESSSSLDVWLEKAKELDF